MPVLPLGQQSCRCWCVAKSDPDSKSFDPEGWRRGALDGQLRSWVRAVKCAPCILPLPPPQVFCVLGVTHSHLPPPWAVTHRVWAKWRLMIGKEEELYGGL